MADASPESIQRLIQNSEKELSQIELLLPLILETRKAVEGAIEKQDGDNEVLDLSLVVLDTLLAENEVIYDLSASLDALLRATDDYTKRYYMQSLNLCFWEACQVFKGEDGDEQGLLLRLEKLTKELNQAGCQYILGHIIDDIEAFRREYTDKELRNITRHYDAPTKMYEKLQELDSIEFFAKGTSQLMAIRMEVSVVSSFLLSLLTPVKNVLQSVAKVSAKSCDLKGMLNDTIFKAFEEKGFRKEIQSTLDKAQLTLDECYRQYSTCCQAIEFLKERECQIPGEMEKMKSLLFLRMETLFLRYDVACSIWGYMRAASDKERSQNLRFIHITKQAALTHIYGYSEKVRENSLWAAIMRIDESRNENLNTESVQKSLEELTGNLAEDKLNSRMFVHYRFKDKFYIPARLEAFDKMVHHKELMDVMNLFNVCKTLDVYTAGLLGCIHDKQRLETKRQRDEWTDKLDNLVAMSGNDERLKEALKPMRDLIDKVYS